MFLPVYFPLLSPGPAHLLAECQGTARSLQGEPRLCYFHIPTSSASWGRLLTGLPASMLQLCSVQSQSRVRFFATPWTAARQAFLSITNSNSCPLSQWCHPAISSSAIPFSCLQSFPASGSFPMDQFFTSGDQSFSFGVSASASVLPMNIQDWFLLGLTGWISLQSKGLSRVFSNTTVQKHQFSTVQISFPYMTTGETIALTRWTFVGKVMSLLFNMLSLS